MRQNLTVMKVIFSFFLSYQGHLTRAKRFSVFPRLSDILTNTNATYDKYKSQKKDKYVYKRFRFGKLVFLPPDIPSYGSQGHFIRGDFLWAASSKSRNDAKGEEIVRSPAVIKDPQLLVEWFSDASLDLTKILGIDFA